MPQDHSLEETIVPQFARMQDQCEMVVSLQKDIKEIKEYIHNAVVFLL